MLRAALGCSLLVATIAEAAPPEMALGTQQLQLSPREEEPVRFAGFAQLTGGGRGGADAGAGAALALPGLGCDLAAGSVQGRLKPFATNGEAAGEATYSVCPIALLFTLKFDGRRGTGIDPSLDARRSLWNRRYDETYDRATLAFGPYWKDDESSRHSIFIMALGHGTTTQTDGPATRTTKQIDLDFALYRYEEQDVGLVVDVVAFTNDAIKAGTDNKGGIASAFMPVRLRYDDGEQFGSVRAGWGMTGGQVTASGSTEVDGETVSSWSETVDGEGLPETSMVVGEIEAGIRRERLQIAARVGRNFYPTFDGNLAREARASGTVTYLPGRTKRTSITFAPFATRTRTWTREDGSSLEVSTGASLHVGRELSKARGQIRIDAIGQAGMSPYARYDGERLGSPQLGGQVLVAVSGRVTELQARLIR